MIYRADESPERIDLSMYYLAYKLNEIVRALANRDYLGDWFARTTHVGHSPFAYTAPKALP
jgi:hypothetical protein